MRGFSQKEGQLRQEGGAEPSRLEKPALKPGRDARPSPGAVARQAAPRPPHARPDGTEAGPAAPHLARRAHDFSLVPAHAPTPPVIQPKLDGRAPADAAEQEADRIAEQLTTMPEPAAPSPAAPRPLAASTLVPRALRSAGRPLDAAARAFAESRSGWDFSQVRVHADDGAAHAAATLGARAYAAGRDIVFGAGQYAPSTAAGRRLLAHELAHVMQQSASSAAAPVRFKKEKEPPKPFYQEALDALEKVRKEDVVELSTGGQIDMFQRIPVVKKFIALAEAVDESDLKEIPTLLDDFVKSDTSRLPINFPSDPLVTTLIARLLLLGLGDEAMSLKAWFHLRERELGPIQKRHERKYSYEKFMWERLLEELVGQIPEKGGGDAALKVLDALLILFERMRDERAGLDAAEIEKDKQRRRELYAAIDSPWSLLFSEEVTISVYFSALTALLTKTFASIQAAYQAVLDAALADLAAKLGDRLLKAAKDRLENRLTRMIKPEKGGPLEQFGDTTTEITRSEFKKGGGQHLDYFAKEGAAKKRTADIEFYDAEALPALAAEKELSFAAILTVRRRQMAVIEQIYGLEKDAQGKPTAETEENKKAIERIGKDGLRLESDDDWRRFLIEKFEERKAKSDKTEALESVVRLLERFLKAFTTHTPHNIKDFGDNVLTKQFPRALTGQLIQDCGVYALRIAYMLSLLREHQDLKLRFRFIALPVHVGLIITGEGLPLYVAHNDHISRFDAQELADLRAEWNKTDEAGIAREEAAEDTKGKKGKKDEEAEEAQFVAELAGEEFVTGADLPFKLLEVPKPRGGPGDIKRDLWNFYTGQVNAVHLFGPETRDPKSPHFQFHLKYLEVLELIKAHHRKHLMPFWNEKAHQAWLKHEPALKKALDALNAAKTDEEKKAAQGKFEGLAIEYSEVIRPALAHVESEFQPVRSAVANIGAALAANPKIINKGIKLTSGARVEAIMTTPWWRDAVEKHLGGLRHNHEVSAPFAKQEQFLPSVD